MQESSAWKVLAEPASAYDIRRLMTMHTLGTTQEFSMSTHLDYAAVRQRQDEQARRAERVRQEREGQAPAWRERLADRLFVGRRPSRPAEAPVGTC